MKKYLIIILFLTTFSCAEDMLDREPLDVMSENVVWTDPALISSYLNGIYADVPFVFYDMLETGQGFNWGNWSNVLSKPFQATAMSDEARYTLWGAEPDFKLGTLNSTGGLFEFWGYDVIRRTNDFIERVSASTSVDEAFKKTKIAEARFLRAYMYFEMVKRYGGVPLITKAQKLDDPEEELYPKRNKEDEIYSFIMTECDACATDLPPSLEYGRATKFAALALKSRAALYAASIAKWGKVQLDGVVGIPNAKSDSYWQMAYNASKQIIESGIFQLYNKYPSDKALNYQNIWLDERNIEVIFAKQYTGIGGVANNFNFPEVPKYKHPWGGGVGTKPYLEMLEEYENADGTPGISRAELTSKIRTPEELWGKKDPRFKGSLYTQGTPWIDITLSMYLGIQDENGNILYTAYNGVNPEAPNEGGWGGPFGILKFLPSKLVQYPDAGDADWVVFRYGEILLNFAEAAFELNKTDEALNAVNQIRNRAGITPLASVTRDAIRHERKIELAFELHRYWDLRRWRTATTALSRNFTSFNYVLDYTSYALDKTKPKFRIQLVEKIDGANSSPMFMEKHYYLPITPNRIANNKNLIENPGYN
jgi:hypothetical protein